MHWYYSEAGQAQGPVSEAKLTELAHSGVISAETLIWQPALEEWKPVIILLPTTLQPEPRKLEPLTYPAQSANPFAAEPEAAAEKRPGFFQRLFGKGRNK